MVSVSQFSLAPYIIKFYSIPQLLASTRGGKISQYLAFQNYVGEKGTKTSWSNSSVCGFLGTQSFQYSLTLGVPESAFEET